MNGQQNPSPDLTAILTELQRIAGALENPRFEKVSEEAPLEAARRLVDYLALRDLMGHPPRDVEKPGSFPAAFDRTKAPPELVIGPIPDGATKVAVFINRGQPAEDVDLSTRNYDLKTKTPTRHPLNVVTKDQVITRLEFRRDDDYPLALGPRLPLV